MYNAEHERDMDLVAKWLSPDLYPSESEDERFISSMAYEYRKTIDDIPEDIRELARDMSDAYNVTKNFI